MPRNKTGGKGGRKGKNAPKTNKQMIYPEEGEMFAHVIGISGNGRFITMGTDGIERTSIIRGKMKKRVWVNRLDVVLITPWDFEDEKASIIHKYMPEESRKLLTKKEIPISFTLEDTNIYNGEDPFAISDFDDENICSLDEKSDDSDSDVDSDVDIDDI